MIGHTSLQWWRQSIYHSLDLQNTSHISPYWVSYEMYSVGIWWENGCIITALHCMSLTLSERKLNLTLVGHKTFNKKSYDLRSCWPISAINLPHQSNLKIDMNVRSAKLDYEIPTQHHDRSISNTNWAFFLLVLWITAYLCQACQTTQQSMSSLMLVWQISAIHLRQWIMSLQAVKGKCVKW